MGQVHCNIIRDLLPSYVDKITSDESNEMIRQHLQECSSCTKTYDTIKSYVFVTDKAEHRMAHFLKRKKKEKTIENRILLFIAIFLLVLQFYCNFIYRNHSGIRLPLYTVNCILYPVYSILLAKALSTWRKHTPLSKTTRLISWVETISLFYITIMFYTLLIIIDKDGMLPFGLEKNQTGPFLVIQLCVLAAVYLLFLLLHLILQRTAGTYNFNIILLSLAAITVSLNANASLYQLDDSSIPVIRTFTIALPVIIAESIQLKSLHKKIWEER